MENSVQQYFKKCSSCKKEIPYGAQYYVCSVSTCRHKRKGFHFCSVPCWDAHLGFANHREAWAMEETAPRAAPISTATQATERAPKKQVVATPSSTPESARDKTRVRAADNIATDTLVVVSKVKKLIKDQSGFNTSQCCVDALTKKVVEECLRGIANAQTAERKTVMGRDIK